MAGILKRWFGTRPTFRPEIEGLLDAELKRHHEALKELLAYAESEERKRKETPGELRERIEPGTTRTEADDEPGAAAE